MTLKVIGAGFGRTGTASMQIALEKLGYAKCYHMFEIRKEMTRAEHWLEALSPQATDWDIILDGYQSTVDWPACAFYKELMAAYPQAKVILTVRDPDKWYQSARETIYPFFKQSPNWFGWFAPNYRAMKKMVSAVVWDGTFQGRFEEAEYAKSVFTQHIEDVKSSVPADQLLVMEVTEGWTPLCQFLDLPVPKDEPFPRVNDAKSMKRDMRTMNVSLGFLYTLLLAAIVMLFLWFVKP